MTYNLPELKYSFTELEPYMDAQTVEIHYSKHHQAYVTNLNGALQKHDIKSDDLVELLKNTDSLPEDIRQAVINNGGGHFNHTLFWDILTPGGKELTDGPLKEAIEKDFGSVEEFKKKFEEAGMKRFGSGWAWLVKAHDGTLKIVTLPNQDAPVKEGVALLGVDLWEHAYYLNYQNRRAEYLQKIWNIIDWSVVEGYYNK